MSAASLQAIAFRFREARALYAGVELGVFAAIGHGAAELEPLARELRCEPRGLEVLLGALVAIGALVRERSQYRLAPGAEEVLLPGGAAYCGNLWLHDLWHWSTWTHAERAVRSGEAQRERSADSHLACRDVVLRFLPNYTLAMEQSAAPWTAGLADPIAALAPRRIVDLGGGSGTLLLALLERLPDSTATLVEHPFALERARELAAGSPHGRRLELVAADFEREPLPADPDAIVLSRVLMGLGAARAEALVDRCARALAPGGALVLHDFDARSRVGALMSLDMLLHGGAQVHGAPSVRRWLEGAGLRPRALKRVVPWMHTWVGVRRRAERSTP